MMPVFQSMVAMRMMMNHSMVSKRMVVATIKEHFVLESVRIIPIVR